MNPDKRPFLPTEQLTAGTHLTAEDGACLMEWVSALAGEPWSDHPGTTHPLLAHLGRLVNDAMSPTGRQALITLAPRLNGLDNQHASTTVELAELATAYAINIRPGLRLAWMHRAAQRHLRLLAGGTGTGRRDGASARLRRRIYDRGPAHRAVETAVIALARTPDADRDLRGLLEHAVRRLEARSSTEVERPAEGGLHRGMASQR